MVKFNGHIRLFYQGDAQFPSRSVLDSLIQRCHTHCECFQPEVPSVYKY